MISFHPSQVISWTGLATSLCLAVGIVAWFWVRSTLTQVQAAHTLEVVTRSTRRGVRLLQINPYRNETDTDIDIIAIHGLDTKSPDTWMWKDPKDPKNEDKWVNWLQDPGMLPSIAGRARIFTCDWPAGLLQPSDLVQKTDDELALLLCDGIQQRASEANDHANKDRPILFLASCLGGILLMKALVGADNNKSSYHSLRRATRGIVFLATPFRGTSFQEVATWAEPALGTWALVRGQETSKLLALVKAADSLGVLVGKFTQLCQDKDNPYRVCTFYELGKTSLPHKVFPWLPSWFYQAKQVSTQNKALLTAIINALSAGR
jgi:hypothetical protein